VESLRSIFLDKIDRIPSFDIQYSIFCGSLFDHAKFHMIASAGLKSGYSNHQETVPFWRSFIQAFRVSGRRIAKS
jgi:hypothetical protein